MACSVHTWRLFLHPFPCRGIHPSIVFFSVVGYLSKYLCLLFSSTLLSFLHCLFILYFCFYSFIFRLFSCFCSFIFICPTPFFIPLFFYLFFCSYSFIYHLFTSVYLIILLFHLSLFYFLHIFLDLLSSVLSLQFSSPASLGIFLADEYVYK